MPTTISAGVSTIEAGLNEQCQEAPVEVGRYFCRDSNASTQRCHHSLTTKNSPVSRR